MKPSTRCYCLLVLVLAVGLAIGARATAQNDPLSSWNERPAKKAIVDFVQATTTHGNPQFVPPAERIATFDQERLAVLLLHDDATREYAYGPAKGLRDSRIGTFPQSLYDQAGKQGWVVISMKNDWKRVFTFDK